MRTGLLAMWAVLTACGPAPVAPVAVGSAFGHFEVTVSDDALRALDPAATWTASVGGIAAYDVTRIDERTVRLTVQGHPAGGDQPLVVSARRVSVELGAVRYTAPTPPRFARVVAFGASLTMGSQDASISQRSQIHGPAAVIARQMGAYLAIPLLKPGFLPALSPADIDPLRCRPRVADLFATIGARAQAELIPKLKDAEGNIAISKLRVDPDLAATNQAIGGFRISETVGGANSFFGTILEHVVWDDRVDGVGLVSHPAQTQLDRLVALQPTLALSTDLFGNDYNNVNLHTDGVPDLAALTPVADLRASLRLLLSRLDETGAEIFLATGPDNTVLPMYPEKVAQLRAAGFSEADATGWLAELRARIVAYNQVLREEAGAYPRVHVVDLHARVARVLSEGVDLGGRVLSPAPFGGLLSLDSMHFSDTGYGALANMFLEEINAALGTRVPMADLQAIHATDAYSVEALQAAGLGCAGTVP